MRLVSVIFSVALIAAAVAPSASFAKDKPKARGSCPGGSYASCLKICQNAGGSQLRYCPQYCTKRGC